VLPPVFAEETAKLPTNAQLILVTTTVSSSAACAGATKRLSASAISAKIAVVLLIAAVINIIFNLVINILYKKLSPLPPKGEKENLASTIMSMKTRSCDET
jgi:hypothetical protein